MHRVATEWLDQHLAWLLGRIDADSTDGRMEQSIDGATDHSIYSTVATVLKYSQGSYFGVLITSFYRCAFIFGRSLKSLALQSGSIPVFSPQKSCSFKAQSPPK